MIKISRYTRARLLVAWWKAIIILSPWNCNITFDFPHADVKLIFLHKSQCDLKFSSFQAIQNYRCSCQSKMKFPINYAFLKPFPLTSSTNYTSLDDIPVYIPLTIETNQWFIDWLIDTLTEIKWLEIIQNKYCHFLFEFNLRSHNALSWHGLRTEH